MVKRARGATQVERKLTFTILHTNDMHSNLLGMAPSSDYSPGTVNDDQTLGGFARLATLIAERKKLRGAQGAVLVLDAGDYSMGTAFGAAIRETGAELQLMARMEYDATTLGNHDFDLGPEGVASALSVAASAGWIPAVVASNTDFSADEATLDGLKSLAQTGVIKRHLVIERRGIRFGIFGLMGRNAAFYATGAGAVAFGDAVETAREMVTLLRETEKVDVVICLSHGGLVANADGTFTSGEDVALSEAVPGIDVVVGGHSHSGLREAIICNGRTPVVQAGKNTESLGELVITMSSDSFVVESYELHRIDDSIRGNSEMTSEINQIKKAVTSAVFAARGYAIDGPLVVLEQDVPNTFADVVAATPLANFVTDANRAATGADIGITVSGMIRAGLTRGISAVQTVYDVFAVTPLGKGTVDGTAGSALMTSYFTGREVKNLLEFMLVDDPAHPGEYFPRVSGMRFRYDTSRPLYDAVTAVELGDADRGYRTIDISGSDHTLYSVTFPLYFGMIALSIPTHSRGALQLTPKDSAGQPLTSRLEAFEAPGLGTPDILPPRYVVDESSLAMSPQNPPCEIKEWQAVMDHLRRLPVRSDRELPVFPLDARATELRALKEG